MNKMNKFFNVEKFVRRTPTFKRVVNCIRGNIQRIDHVSVRTFDPIKVHDICKKNYYEVQNKTYHFPRLNVVGTYYYNPNLAVKNDVSSIFLSSYKGAMFDENYSNIVDIELINFYQYNPKYRIMYGTYEDIHAKNQYLAWDLCFRNNISNITFKVNSVEEVNHILKKNNIELNQDDAEIKVSSDGLLLQSSTVADKISYTFKNGRKEKIPYGYIGFVERLPGESGLKRKGFDEISSNYIFDSTK